MRLADYPNRSSPTDSAEETKKHVSSVKSLGRQFLYMIRGRYSIKLVSCSIFQTLSALRSVMR